MQPQGTRLPERLMGDGWQDMQGPVTHLFIDWGLDDASAFALATALNTVVLLTIFWVVGCHFLGFKRAAWFPFRAAWWILRHIGRGLRALMYGVGHVLGWVWRNVIRTPTQQASPPRGQPRRRSPRRPPP